MPKNSARRAFLWQLIAKNRKRRLALYTALRTVYQRRQLLLQVACLTVRLLANNKGAAVLSRSCRRFQCNVGWFSNVWPTYSEKRFKETYNEHLFQIGNSHLKHLYLVFIKHEKHISITLCDVSNDLRELAIPCPISSPESS